ncbi:Nitrilase [Rhinocladiella similis]
MSSTATSTDDGSKSKKLAQPPVKVACTSCRASRTRCDGQKPICQNCLVRGKECRYLKSNRGGPRVSRKKAMLAEEQRRRAENSAGVNGQAVPPDADWGSLVLSSETLHDELIGSMIAPGAGLLDLDNESHSDEIFDSIFPDMPKSDHSSDVPDSNMQFTPYNPVIRHYQDNKSILNAYYIFIHPYFPILPPPPMLLEVDDPGSESKGFQPLSPLTMALLAILVLIPHPDDLFYDSDESVCQRRQEAHAYSQMAIASIEYESELLESTTNPATALESSRPFIQREALHPYVPIELESLLAYLVLSVYEYAQRGNLAKMRNRASQAYDAAVSLGLDDTSSLALDEYTEARRRAWWMTYTVAMQCAIVAGTPPMIMTDLALFRTPFPMISSDPDAWFFFLEAQQVICQCTQYTAALKKALEAGVSPNELIGKKTALDKDIDTILYRHSAQPVDIQLLSPTDFEEQTLAKSLRAQAQIKLNSARIKLHRYNAFQDLPLFTRKHCDLEPADPTAPRQLGCSCHSVSPTVTPESSHSGKNSISPVDPDPMPKLASEIPFNDLVAAKTCMKAALAIGRAFEVLPYPNPMQLSPPIYGPSMLSITSMNSAPRTMPSFACCAMQSCYTLLTLCYRSLERQCLYQRSVATDKGLEGLYVGISRVLAALQNYSMAFEALNGMTQQVEEALDAVKGAK